MEKNYKNEKNTDRSKLKLEKYNHQVDSDHCNLNCIKHTSIFVSTSDHNSRTS